MKDYITIKKSVNLTCFENIWNILSSRGLRKASETGDKGENISSLSDFRLDVWVEIESWEDWVFENESWELKRERYFDEVVGVYSGERGRSR